MRFVTLRMSRSSDCMFCTRDMVGNMDRMIQVRNVPEGVHRTLKSRAALAGMSLSDYVKQQLVESASMPTLAELDARARKRAEFTVGVTKESIVEAIREVRDS